MPSELVISYSAKGKIAQECKFSMRFEAEGAGVTLLKQEQESK